jgi:predicted DNA-binding antitoxin AbrB/MazE fold protein
VVAESYYREAEMPIVITVRYRDGMLRPVEPLDLPEDSEWQITIMDEAEEEDASVRARRLLQEAGIIAGTPPASAAPVSDEDLYVAARTLGAAGPLSCVILDERDVRLSSMATSRPSRSFPLISG